MATVTTYLASLPPDHTTALVVLGGLAPCFLLVLAGFAACHAADVAADRLRGL